MERENLTKSEYIALTLEKGKPEYRQGILKEMSRNGRFCENIVVVLKAMMLYNHEQKEHEGIK